MSITPVYLSIKTINYTDYAGLPLIDVKIDGGDHSNQVFYLLWVKGTVAEAEGSPLTNA
jgi:hypothetical protein